MSERASPTTTVDVADLQHRPGMSRPVRRELDGDLMPSVPLVSATGSVDVDLLLESLVDGILARGTIEADAQMSCARCLADMGSRVTVDVAELFADPARTRDDELEEGYVISEVAGRPHIDLATLVRDALSGATPLRPLCRPDCQGLCAGCGADLNAEQCDCTDELVDDRWAVLRTLDLPDGRG